jgi:hypothetical protein
MHDKLLFEVSLTKDVLFEFTVKNIVILIA